tara:strand:+ start:271 stop:795 length:525 start_codon:yes stop_codon:yes gene_type:complete
MKTNYIKYIFFFFGIFVLFIFYFGLSQEKKYDTENIIGNKIPQFTVSTFEKNQKLTNNKIFDNKNYTLINFWASWCSPCRKEHSILLKLSKIKNLNLLGINYKDNKENAQKFLTELGNPFNFIGVDQDGKNLVAFGIYGIPESILVNQENIIIKKFIGPLNNEDIEIILKELKK